MHARREFVAVALVLFTFGKANAQRTNGSYARYAQMIQEKGDSAWLLMQRPLPAIADEIGVAPFLEIRGRRITALAGDLDAVVPPSDLARLHEQLIAPLMRLGEHVSRAAALLSVNCSAAQTRGEACNEPARKIAGIKLAMVMLESAGEDVLAYETARARAVEMLAEHHVTLAPLAKHPGP